MNKPRFPINKEMKVRLLNAIKQGYFTHDDIMAVYAPLNDNPADLSVLTNEELRTYYNLLCKVYHEQPGVFLNEQTE